MNRKLASLFFLLIFAIIAKAQEIQQIKQEGRNIVVSYFLQKDAVSVNLFVSLDGGETFKGPLKYVTGDLKNVAAGEKEICWDVVKEFNGLKGDDIRFKITTKFKKVYSKETLILLNGAYSLSPQFSYGITFGQVKKFGWYVNAMSNFKFRFSSKYKCNNNGFVDNNLPFYSGDKSTTRLSIMGGGIARIIKPLFIYLGAGYGFRGLFWETSDGQWIKNASSSYSGINAEIGLMGNIKGFAFSAGVSTINFQYLELKIGLGINMKLKK